MDNNTVQKKVATFGVVSIGAGIGGRIGSYLCGGLGLPSFLGQVGGAIIGSLVANAVLSSAAEETDQVGEAPPVK